MKIRTWLLVSYLIVMLLPLVAGYGLFLWINAYHDERNVEESLAVYFDLNDIQQIATDPSLYQVNSDYTAIDQLGTDQVSITIYNDVGFMLHSTRPINKTFLSFLQRKQLYEGLYEQRQRFGTIQYKEPVFSGSTLVGIYEVEWARGEWVAGVSKRTWSVSALFIVFFITVFLMIAVLVNRKLNQPLARLMKQMDSFGKGLPVEPIQISNDELGELAKSFELMQEDLIEANQKLAEEQNKKEFMIASISHDLKTPLTSIRAYSEALESKQLSENEQKEYRKVIREKVHYMRQMLDDLLMHTLLQSSTYTMEQVKVDGEEFFDMLVSGYRTLCSEKGIHLDVISDVTGEYAVNAKQLMRVVDNLMMNAITHTQNGRKVGLAAIYKGQQPDWCFEFIEKSIVCDEGMYLIVQNEGDGLTESQLGKVFEPLYQADEARTKDSEKGTGLGLSITKQIIEKHGGTVEMLSRKEVGTAVICYLPKLKGENES